MPIKIGDKSYKNLTEAVIDVKRNHPEVKDPVAYVVAVEKTIEKRRAEKAERAKQK
jgi:hypothetical protein